MSTISKERFALKKGRARPPYKPKNIHCAGCGAGLTVKDELAELVVCDHCGRHLDISEEEMKVLGNSPDRKWDFPLKVGDSFRHKGARFEVIARMAFIEDGDYLELTRQYLLYHPRRGTLWLDEYKSQYSLSSDTHVMPKSDPFTRRRGQALETHDGKQWVTEETGVYELKYVDGALPWIAKIGDTVAYAEFSQKDGSGGQYEAQSIQNEVEYGTGRALPLSIVRRATGKPDLEKGMDRVVRMDAAQTRRGFNTLFAAAAIALVVNALLAFVFYASGKEALRQGFTAEQLKGEAFSLPFDVSKDNNIVKIHASAPSLDNGWMALNFALVRGDDSVIHVLDADMEYYHGREGGENWSEGSRSVARYVKVPEAGSYRLLVNASAEGEGNLGDRNPINVRVIDGAMRYQYSLAAAIFSLVVLGVLVFAYLKWAGLIESDDED